MYSQHLPSPDEGPLPTVFGFDQDDNIELVDSVLEEEDKVHKVQDEAFGVMVHYYDNHVVFTQKVKLKSSKATALKGYIAYMVCSETMCIPKDLDFSIAVTQ